MKKLASGVATTLIGLTTSALVLPMGVASAGTVPAYSGTASANLAHIELLKQTLLPSQLEADLADVKLTTADAMVDSQAAHTSEAVAKNLEASALNSAITIALQEAHQVAPASPEETSTDMVSVDAGGLLTTSVGSLTASARDVSTEIPPVDAPIAKATSQLADVDLLRSDLSNVDEVAQQLQQLPPDQQLAAQSEAAGLDTSAVLDLGVAGATSEIALTAVDGQDTAGLRSTSTVDAADIVLFEGTALQTTVSVISKPTLTAVAAGTDASGVDYAAPLLRITTPAGELIDLATPSQVVNIPILAGVLNVQLTLGSIEDQSVTPTDVSATAALLRVALTVGLPDPTGLAAYASDPSAQTQIAPLTLLNVALGEQSVRATVPDGGIGTPVDPTDPGQPEQPQQPQQPQSEQPQPIAGPPAPPEARLADTNASSDPAPYLLAGGGLLLVGTVLLLVVRRKRLGKHSV